MSPAEFELARDVYNTVMGINITATVIAAVLATNLLLMGKLPPRVDSDTIFFGTLAALLVSIAWGVVVVLAVVLSPALVHRRWSILSRVQVGAAKAMSNQVEQDRRKCQHCDQEVL